MKRIFVLALALMSLTAFAQDNLRHREGGGRLGATAIYLVFNSPGNGIDGKSYSLAMKLIKAAQRRNEVVDYTNEAWGREGEHTVCVEFSDAFLPHAFKKKVAKSILKDEYRRTQIYSGTSCGNIEEATLQDLEASIR